MKTFQGYHELHDLPINPGMMVTIKKGVLVKTVGRDTRPAGKTYKVKVHHLLPGCSPHPMFVGEMAARTRTENPKVVWAGPGGYWSEVDINDVPEAQTESSSSLPQTEGA